LERDNEMKVTREKVIAVLVGIGFKTAGKWSKDKLQKKVNLLHTIVDEDTTTNDDALDELLDEIISNDDVEVVRGKKKAKKKAEAEPEVEKEEEEAEKKVDRATGKKKKDKSSTKEQPKKRVNNKMSKTDSVKEEVSCDKFGSKLDSDNAKVNIALSKKGKTVRQLTKKAGVELKSKYYAHLDRLIEAGHITQDEDGTYKLV